MGLACRRCAKMTIVHFGGENLPASKLRMRNSFSSPPPGGVMGLARRRCTKEVIVHLSGETYRLAVKLNKNTLHKLWFLSIVILASDDGGGYTV